MVTKFQLILGMTITMCLLVIVIVETTPGGHGRIWNIDARPMRYTPPIGGCERIFSEAWTTQHAQSLQFEMHLVDIKNAYREESPTTPSLDSLYGGEEETEVTAFLGVGQVCKGQVLNEHTMTELQKWDTQIRDLCHVKWEGSGATRKPGVCARFEDEIIDNHALDMNHEAQLRCVFLCCHEEEPVGSPNAPAVTENAPADMAKRRLLSARGRFSDVAHCPVDVTMTWNSKNPFNRDAGNLVPRNQFTASSLLWTNVFYVCCFVDVMLLCSLIAMGFIFLNRYM